MEKISRGPTFGGFVTIRTEVDAGHHCFKTIEYRSTDSFLPLL